MGEVLYRDEVYAIVGAAMEVYNHLGAGFLEPIYQEALGIEFIERLVPSKAQHEINIIYKGKPLKKTYATDFLCFDKIIVEIKALDKLSSREEAQLINYLKATDMKVGVLINFGTVPSLEWRRLIFTQDHVARYAPLPVKIRENSR
jgi:GxxExxY protein